MISSNISSRNDFQSLMFEYPIQPISKEPTIQSEVHSPADLTKRNNILHCTQSNINMILTPRSETASLVQQDKSIFSKCSQFLDLNLQIQTDNLFTVKLLINRLNGILLALISIIFVYEAIIISYDDQNDFTKFGLIIITISKLGDILIKYFKKQQQKCYKSFIINQKFQIIYFSILGFLLTFNLPNMVYLFLLIVLFSFWNDHFQGYLSIIKLLIYLNYIICLWHNMIQFDEEITQSNSYLVDACIIISVLTMNTIYQPITEYQHRIYLVCQVVSLIYLFYLISISLQIIDKIKQKQNSCVNLLKYKLVKSYFEKYSFSDQTIDQFTQVVNTNQYDLIFNEGDYEDLSLYLIMEGEYEILDRNGRHLGYVYDYFGEYGFYHNQPRTATIKCVQKGKLLKIEYNRFLKSLQFHQNQIYQDTFQKMMHKLPKNCISCSSNSHYINQCPSLMYKPALDQLLLDSNQFNERHKYIRRQGKDTKSFEIYNEYIRNQAQFEVLYQDHVINEYTSSDLPYDEKNNSSGIQEISEYYKDNSEEQYQSEQQVVLSKQIKSRHKSSGSDEECQKQVDRNKKIKVSINCQPLTSIMSNQNITQYRSSIRNIHSETFKSEFSPFSKLDQQQTIFYDIDQMAEYSYFSPEFNFSQILQKFPK